jgi:hypothetical protein
MASKGLQPRFNLVMDGYDGTATVSGPERSDFVTSLSRASFLRPLSGFHLLDRAPAS